jgi:hypothetical protein
MSDKQSANAVKVDLVVGSDDGQLQAARFPWFDIHRVTTAILSKIHNKIFYLVDIHCRYQLWRISPLKTPQDEKYLGFSCQPSTADAIRISVIILDYIRPIHDIYNQYSLDIDG